MIYIYIYTVKYLLKQYQCWLERKSQRQPRPCFRREHPRFRARQTRSITAYAPKCASKRALELRLEPRGTLPRAECAPVVPRGAPRAGAAGDTGAWMRRVEAGCLASARLIGSGRGCIEVRAVWVYAAGAPNRGLPRCYVACGAARQAGV